MPRLVRSVMLTGFVLRYKKWTVWLESSLPTMEPQGNRRQPRPLDGLIPWRAHTTPWHERFRLGTYQALFRLVDFIHRADDDRGGIRDWILF